ncbi:MAG: hypothetical protein GEU71_15520 [Actinobacteria bacterium]|nr:hypothetical protein [Actinomycetota bacterium]
MLGRQVGAISRWIIVAVVVAAVAAGGGFALLGGDDDDQGEDGNVAVEASPTPTPTPESTAVATLPDPERLPSDQLFAKKMIEQRVVLNHEGDKEVRIFFVNPDVTSDAFKATRICVRQALKDDRFYAATCYGFVSQEAFDASGIDPDTGKMETPCWWGHFGKTTKTDGSGSFVNTRYEELDCPPPPG